MKALEDIHLFTGVGILLFSAEWCGPCKILKSRLYPMLDAELKDIQFEEINVDSHPEFAQKYGVKSIPTLILFNGDDILKVSNKLDDIIGEIDGLLSEV